MRKIVLLIATSFSAIAVSPVQAKAISGEVGIYSQFADRDVFVQADKPVVQGLISLGINEHCSTDVWFSYGITTKVGGEIDLGASCRFNISENTEIELLAYRDVLSGLPDVTETGIKVTHGRLDLTVTQYFWDKNPDATRAEIGYTIQATEKLELHPAVVYETGFGEADVVVGALDLSYALSDKLSLKGSIFVPVYKGTDGYQKAQALIGISCSF